MSGRGHGSVGEDAEAVRIGMLGGFRVPVVERTIVASAWLQRKAASLAKLVAFALDHRLHRRRALDAVTLKTRVASCFLDPCGYCPPNQLLPGGSLQLAPGGTRCICLQSFTEN